MALNFTTSGYIEVYRDGFYFSRHRLELEAVESILNDEIGMVYEIRRPVTVVKKTKPQATMTITGEISGNA